MGQKLNQLDTELPEGLVVDADWMNAHEFSRALRSHYVQTGWLEQPTPRVFRRPRGPLGWREVVVSLQILMDYPLVVGGRTALELQGYGHYVGPDVREVHLYGPLPPPTWLKDLTLGVTFHYHTGARLFAKGYQARALSHVQMKPGSRELVVTDPIHAGMTLHRDTQDRYPLTVSTLERALLELLDQLPHHESFHQVDVLFEGLNNLSPRRMQGLLESCRSIKVKRLFFFFADRHPHSWTDRLDRGRIDLGKGKRQLVPAGRYVSAYAITVPEDF